MQHHFHALFYTGAMRSAQIYMGSFTYDISEVEQLTTLQNRKINRCYDRLGALQAMATATHKTTRAHMHTNTCNLYTMQKKEKDPALSHIPDQTPPKNVCATAPHTFAHSNTHQK